MAAGKTFTDKTSAADKSIGFDYQYYYFLDCLLNLKTGESVGLEVLDDVHLKVNADLQLLFQLKHTTSVTASGNPVNLTSLDDDLWKTMSNWSKVITDSADGRSKKESQIQFIKKTEFHLVSNKSWSAENKFLARVIEYCKDTCSFFEIRNEVQSLKMQTKNLSIKTHIEDVLSLDDAVMSSFFLKLRFQLNENEITEKIRRSISEKFIDDSEIENVFARLDSNIREDNFYDTKSGRPICINYDQFMARYRKIFTTSRSVKLSYFSYKPVMPSDILNQRFVSQLLHIGDVDKNDLEIIADYTVQKLRLARNLNEWHQSGQLVSDEIERFHDEVCARWKVLYRAKFRRARMPSEPLDAALELLDVLRNNRFK
ncbi:MAG: hypothetical protein EOO18_13165, partial [Chryseobacterium sp.]